MAVKGWRARGLTRRWVMLEKPKEFDLKPWYRDSVIVVIRWMVVFEYKLRTQSG